MGAVRRHATIRETNRRMPGTEPAFSASSHVQLRYTEPVSVVYIALPVALLLAVVGVMAFIWAVRSGQMDDLETPGQRVLFDDDVSPDSRSIDLEEEQRRN
jgi:cbb3-type cytochrome oxidase maturation protein